MCGALAAAATTAARAGRRALQNLRRLTARPVPSDRRLRRAEVAGDGDERLRFAIDVVIDGVLARARVGEPNRPPLLLLSDRTTLLRRRPWAKIEITPSPW